MKAAKPIQYRFVKVKTTGNLTDQQVTDLMLMNTLDGRVPKWEEIIEEDTPELDTETVFELHDLPKEKGYLPQNPMHQTTIPLPMDIFGKVLRSKTAQQAGRYCLAVCKREEWKPTYENMMAALNNLDMD